MKKKIVVIVIIFLNLILLVFQLSNKFASVKAMTMEEDYYPFSLVTDNKNIYFIGIEFAGDGSVEKSQICQMEKGESNPQAMNIEPPKDMMFYQLYLDNNNALYTFLCDNQNERCEIWKITKNKEIVNKIDISRHIRQNEAYGITSFAVDIEGRYYLREWMGTETIVLDREGKELCRIEDSKIGFHCMGSARNGKIYILYQTPEIKPVRMEIASFNIDEKRLEVEAAGDFLPLDDIYSVLEAGNRCDFLIRGMRGAFKYSLGDEKAKKVIDSFYIDGFEYNASTSSFLKDNKLLMIAKRQRIGEAIQTGDIRLYYYSY